MIYNDYHIHLHHSPCTSAEMTAPAILEKAEACGLTEVGLVNHLHPHTNLDIFIQARTEIESLAGPTRVMFRLGAEIELLDQKGHTTNRPDLYRSVDYVLLAMGHIQLPWVKIDLSPSPEVFLARECESLLTALDVGNIDVVAHPFIYTAMHRIAPHLIGKLWPDRIPVDLLEVLAVKLKDTGVALEFHCRDLWVRPENLGGEPFVRSYLELLRFFQERDVDFVAGSDAHYLDQVGRSKLAPPVFQRGLGLSGKEVS